MFRILALLLVFIFSQGCTSKGNDNESSYANTETHELRSEETTLKETSKYEDRQIKWDRIRIISIFETYGLLHEEFQSITSKYKNDNVPFEYYSAYRRSIEEFGSYPNTPFYFALQDAVTVVCNVSDKLIVGALFNVYVKTQSSASESDDSAIERMVECKPQLVKDVFNSLSEEMQQTIIDIPRHEDSLINGLFQDE